MLNVCWIFAPLCRAPESQLRLFDIRLRKTELHAFGWRQDSSESQSALINQAWSPDGLCITSGSADPVIHVFDIRYNASRPFQSMKAHQKRVFKAAWHRSLPLLVSISSDLSIGMHKITWGPVVLATINIPLAAFCVSWSIFYCCSITRSNFVTGNGYPLFQSWKFVGAGQIYVRAVRGILSLAGNVAALRPWILRVLPDNRYAGPGWIWRPLQGD